MGGTWSLSIACDPANGLTYTVGGIDIERMPRDVYDDLDRAVARIAGIMSYSQELQEGFR